MSCLHPLANAPRNLLFYLNELLSICHITLYNFTSHRNTGFRFWSLPGPGLASPGLPRTCPQWAPGWWTSPSPPHTSPGHCCPRWAAEKQAEPSLQISEKKDETTSKRCQDNTVQRRDQTRRHTLLHFMILFHYLQQRILLTSHVYRTLAEFSDKM